jgi:hypothetical protein
MLYVFPSHSSVEPIEAARASSPAGSEFGAAMARFSSPPWDAPAKKQAEFTPFPGGFNGLFG